MIAYDIVLDASGDLPLTANNFTIGPSDNQHLADMMLACPGWWRRFPQNGIAIISYFKARVQPLKVTAKVKQQCNNDRYILIDPQITFVAGAMGIIPNAIRP